MKSKLFRIFGVATTVAVLVSMLSIAPALGLTQPQVALTTGALAAFPNNVAYVISNNNVYHVTFTAGVAVPASGKIVIGFPAGTNITGLAAAGEISYQALTGIGGGPVTPQLQGLIPNPVRIRQRKH